MKKSQTERSSRKCISTFWEYFNIVVISTLIPLIIYWSWMLVRMLLFDYFTVPSESMCPTLMPGDKVIANKLILGARIYTDFDFDLKGQELKSFRLKDLRRIRCGDIVVFNFPYHEGKLNFVINNVYCKRVVALPGDSISAADGHYRNCNYGGVLGIKAEQDYLQQLPDSMLGCGFWIPPYQDTGWNIKNFGPLYVPRKGDVIKVGAKEAAIYLRLLEWELGKSVSFDWERNTACADDKPLHRHRFQHDYYYMVGDNVSNSSDSRYWGFVPEEYVIGVIDKVVRDGKIINPYIIDE